METARWERMGGEAEERGAFPRHLRRGSRGESLMQVLAHSPGASWTRHLELRPCAEEWHCRCHLTVLETVHHAGVTFFVCRPAGGKKELRIIASSMRG